MNPKQTLLLYAAWGLLCIVLWIYDWKLGLSWLVSGAMMPQLTEEAMIYVNHTMNYKPKKKKPTNDDHP